MNIFLSASVPLPSRHPQFIETADIMAIREAIKALVLVVLERGDHIVFGGHPAITPMIRLLMDQAGADVGEFFTLYQSAFFKGSYPLDNAAFERVVIIEAIEGNLLESLTVLRNRMIGDTRFDCAVFIGGMEGLFQEHALFRQLQPHAAVYPIASTGAAAAMLHGQIQGREDLLTELTYPTLFRRLLRELSPG